MTENIEIESCGDCPLVFDSHIGCFCYESSSKIPDKGTKENCPLKQGDITIELKGVDTASAEPRDIEEH